jgi:hypothetical protein
LLGFFFTLCVPPFPSFVSESFFFISSLLIWKFYFLFLVLFRFLSLVYNLNWFSSVVFSFLTPSSSIKDTYISYSVFMPMLIQALSCFIFCFFFIIIL